jgi:putative ATP-dependent endonuclease of OLD family
MKLTTFTISRFRVIRQMTLNFSTGVNLLIGENNAGKTAVLDALRLTLRWGAPRRDLYINADCDFFVDAGNPTAAKEPIEFNLVFKPTRPNDLGIFHELLSMEDERGLLKLNFRFTYDRTRSNKIAYEVWGGDMVGQQVSAGTLDLLHAVYLGALRDTVSDLRPVRGNRVADLLENIEPSEPQRTALAARVRGVLENDEEWTSLLTTAKQRVNEHLESMSLASRPQRIDLSFLPHEFRRIVESIQVRLPLLPPSAATQDQRFFEISQNGLGYNNIIYIAALLGDLKARTKRFPSEYRAILIEEPEAHLHPQVQLTLLEYMASMSRGYQIFISSHSPTLVAKASIANLNVLRIDGASVASSHPSNVFGNSSLERKQKQLLERFLDTTRSQLFFANGVVLVEGIAEALLLPAMSRILGAQEGDPLRYDLERHGIEVVNINGVSFEPFAKLFTGEGGLSSRCALLTDSDGEGEELSPRAQRAANLAAGSLATFVVPRTLEHALFSIAENQELMRKLYRDLHPLTEITDADNLLVRLESNKDKGEFAQLLGRALHGYAKSGRNDFVIPDAIASAIRWSLGKEGQHNG